MTHFVLMTQPMTADQERALVSQLAGLGWWHNLPNAWLIVDNNGTLTAERLRAMVEAISPNTNCLALQVDPKTWASRNNHIGDPNIGAWLRNYWYNGP